jgi:hypothetical protein
VQVVAGLVGAVLLLVGIAGFIPGLTERGVAARERRGSL